MKLKRVLRGFVETHMSIKQFKTIRSIYGFFVAKYNKCKYRERKISYGREDADHIYYVIRGVGMATLLQLFHDVLSHVIYAYGKGYIPIVDMRDEDIIYRTNSMDSVTDNVWEYFFEQPQRLNVKDVHNCKNVILSSIGMRCGVNPRNIAFNDNKEEIMSISKIIAEKLRLNNETREYINHQYEKLLAEYKDARVIGVHIRGTDYFGLKPKGHCIQPDVQTIILKTKELINTWNVDAIYVCTEDADMLCEFENSIGIPVFYTKCARISRYSMDKGFYLEQFKYNDAEKTEKQNGYINGLEYLTDIFLLSRCSHLISGDGLMGTAIAILINGNRYMDKYIFSLGKY